MKNQSIANNIDWISIIIYALLVILGWLNIYSSSLSSMEDTYEKKLIFIVLTIPLIFIVLSVDGKFYEKYATIIFGISLLTLAGLFLFGKRLQDSAAGMQ
jgi:rod shape determining protein RodA